MKTEVYLKTDDKQITYHQSPRFLQIENMGTDGTDTVYKVTSDVYDITRLQEKYSSMGTWISSSEAYVFSETNFVPSDEQPDFPPPLTLDELKQKRYEEIDAKTAQLFESGFDLGGGAMTSLSLESQSSWHALNAERNILTYPFEVSTIDEAGYEIADATELNNTYKSAIGYIDTIKKAARVIKKQIRSAADEAAVNAIVDTR